jgi:hypothetical protein
MATVVDPTTAIQKKVNVSVNGKKSFTEEVYFLEIWSVGDVNSQKTLEVKGESNRSGAFKQVQFKFDKNSNYIYTKSDVNQKEFDKTYKGTASEFSISGLSAGNANTVIRISKTNSPNDVPEMYNGLAERVDVKVGVEPDKPTKPTEGNEKSGGNKDPNTWKVVNMTDNPALFKVTDDADKNVATDFTRKEIAQQYIDYHKSVNVEQVKCPPGQFWDSIQGKCVEAPPPMKNGIEYLSGIDFDKGNYSTHNTGPRIQHGARLDILNRESEAYFKLLKGQKPDEMSWGVRGGPHSNGKDVREYKFYMPISGHDKVFAKEYGKDSDKKYDKVEPKTANEKGFNLLEIRKESQAGKMGKEITVDPEKEFGMKVRHYNLDKDGDGKSDAVKLEAFVDFKDGNGWQKYIEGEDDGTKLEGPGPLTKIYKDDERDHIRVDNCGECSKSNHSVYIPGTYKVGLIKGGLGEDDKYWPWENTEDNWNKKDGDN